MREWAEGAPPTGGTLVTCKKRQRPEQYAAGGDDASEEANPGGLAQVSEEEARSMAEEASAKASQERVETDPYESTDLADSNQRVVKRLARKIERWWPVKKRTVKGL